MHAFRSYKFQDIVCQKLREQRFKLLWVIEVNLADIFGTRSIYCWLYYRASECNACRTRYCFTNSVRLSVRPMPVLCLNEWPIITLFWESGRGIILILWALPLLQNSNGNPLSGGVKCTGMGSFCRYCSFSRKRYVSGPYLLWNANMKS